MPRPRGLARHRPNWYDEELDRHADAILRGRERLEGAVDGDGGNVDEWFAAELAERGVDPQLALKMPRQEVDRKAMYRRSADPTEGAVEEGADPETPASDARAANLVAFEEKAKYVRVNPPSAWAGSQGNVQTVRGGGPELPLAWWQGDEDPEAQPVTITILPLIGDIRPTGVASSAQVYRPYANVKWGSRGMVAEADVDIGLGTQFTVGASSVFVSGGADSGSQPVTVGGMISFWSIHRQQVVTRTSYINTLAAAAESNIVIPNFANSLAYFMRTDPTGQVRFRFYDIDETAEPWVGTFGANQYQTSPIILPNDAMRLEVTNQGPDTIGLRIMWGLAF